jgi:hypothetical protein
MIVWSYSIFGSNTEVYYKPMLENIRLAKSNNVKVVISTTEQYFNIIRDYFIHELEYIHIETYPSNIYVGIETILRFLTVEKVEAEYYFIKDSDSIVTARELYIMNHWMLMTKYNYIIIRDNPLHVAPILAGMFGFRKNAKNLVFKSCINNLHDFNSKIKYGFDQQWLTEKIYHFIIAETQVYSSFFHFSNENLIRLSRVNNSNFIGAQCLGNINPKSKEHDFLNVYADKLLSIPFISSVPKYFSRLIYGRVRPSIYLSYFFKLIKF